MASTSHSDHNIQDPDSQHTTSNLRKRRRIQYDFTPETESTSDASCATSGEHEAESVTTHISFQPLLDVLEHCIEDEDFSSLFSELRPSYELSRDILHAQSVENGTGGQRIRPLTRCETAASREQIRNKAHTDALYSLIARKLANNLRAADPSSQVSTLSDAERIPKPLSANMQLSKENLESIHTLNLIHITPYHNTFQSRVHGCYEDKPVSNILAVDWDVCPPWLMLMDDIKQHYALRCLDGAAPSSMNAPIQYETLQQHHLMQANELLSQAFWEGIDVSDSLDHFPERCTVVVVYKKLVVGVAILCSPQETYITYLAVRVGWENSRIATKMLYHLISLNPHSDISLHVSTNNPAMLLYNQFGFKIEEFISGFYENYLDPRSGLSRNAFKLRLRHA